MMIFPEARHKKRKTFFLRAMDRLLFLIGRSLYNKFKVRKCMCFVIIKYHMNTRDIVNTFNVCSINISF